MYTFEHENCYHFYILIGSCKKTAHLRRQLFPCSILYFSFHAQLSVLPRANDYLVRCLLAYLSEDH